MAVDPELQKFCLLMGFAFAGVILLALGAKLAEVYQARHWLATTGTITKSKVRTHKRAADDEGHEYRSEPLVAYEYQVAGKSYRGTRVSFAESSGGADLMPTLARYPVGKSVQVYYNPAKPEQSVLERELPPLALAGVAILVAVFLGAAVLLPLALTGAGNMLADMLPHPERAFAVTMLGAMGLFTLLLWLAFQRQVRAANGWSVATGKVLVADVESFQEMESSASGSLHSTTTYRPSVVYSFEANGQQFISDRVGFGAAASGTVAGSVPWFVSQQAAKYPVGSQVTVYYNPQNPTESVLERRATGSLLLLGIIVALWGLAVFLAAS